MKSRLGGMLVATLGVMLSSVPAFAHHSFVAEYDGSKPVEVDGVVVKSDWINPHIYLYVDVKDKTGKVTTWAIEGGPTRHMRDAGLTKTIMDSWVGQNVRVYAYPGKDGKPIGFLKTMFFPDGHFFAYATKEEDTSGLGDVQPQAGK